MFALVLVCLSSSTRAMEEISEKTWEKLHRYSLLCNCYGEGRAGVVFKILELQIIYRVS